MTPKGNYWEDKKNEYISKGTKMILDLSNKIYPDITDLNALQEKVSEDMNPKLTLLIQGIASDIKNTYKEYCDHVFTVLPVSGLTELLASEHRENQYLSSINNGIFATTTMDSIEQYIRSTFNMNVNLECGNIYSSV